MGRWSIYMRRVRMGERKVVTSSYGREDKIWRILSSFLFQESDENNISVEQH